MQSCFEPRFVEPRVLSYKLTLPKSISSQSLFQCPKRPSALQNQEEHRENPPKEEEITKNSCDHNGGSIYNCDFGDWSFIEAFAAAVHHNCKEATENQKVYVHPLVTRFSSTLSMRSLEMCTESLGSESGSDISEISDEFSSSVLLRSHENPRSIQRSKPREFTKKPHRNGNFPPPLTSISGSDGVRVRSHREDGRLVIKAESAASCNSYFQAQRGGGRLRLCLMKDKQNTHNEEANEVEARFIGEYDDEPKFAEDYYDDDEEDVVGDVDSCGHLDFGGDNDNDYDSVQGIGGISGSFGCGMEIRELPRPSGWKDCRGGHEGMSGWGPFLRALC
ncbi:hypothetical protein U1Q18_020187 [Sarracenia purpurea var. burkii]